MAKKIKISHLTDAIMESLNDYAKLATEDVKTAIKEAGETAKDEIRQHAPKDSGDYAKSWAVKTVKETASTMQVVVHSKNRYQLAHLLEYGHAKRGGGRVAAKPHIANAEETAIEQLEKDIERKLKNG